VICPVTWKLWTVKVSFPVFFPELTECYGLGTRTLQWVLLQGRFLVGPSMYECSSHLWDFPELPPSQGHSRDFFLEGYERY
jgi:hypothetical protein